MLGDLEKEAFSAGLSAFLKKVKGPGRAALLSNLKKLPGGRRRAAEVVTEAAKKVTKRKPGLKVSKSFAAGVSDKDKERALRGYRSQAMREGVDSVVLYPLQLAAEKILGKGKVRKALWKYVNKPALEVDTALGNVLAKTPLVGKAFKTKEHIPWGKNLSKKVERSSALGPLTKVRDVSEPILVGVGLDKGIRKATEIAKGRHEGQMDQSSQSSDRQLREKVASAMLRLDSENREHTKRAHALRLLYKQAELGVAQLPQTYSELQEKLASMEKTDLEVFEKALELNGGSVKIGHLAQSLDPDSRNSSEQFQAAILGDDV